MSKYFPVGSIRISSSKRRPLFQLWAAVILWSALSFGQAFGQCTGTSCTYSTTPANNSSYNLNTGETLCITGSGTYTGSINFNGAATICVGPNVSFQPGSFNNFGTNCNLNVFGAAYFQNSISLNGGVINDSGSVRFGANPNQNGAVTFNIARNAGIQFDQGFTLASSSVINNKGTIISLSDFSTSTGTTLTNYYALRVGANNNFNPSGDFTNRGIVTAKFINFNSNANEINYCRLVAFSGFNIAGSGVQNHGLIYVPGDNTSSGNIQISSAFDNTGGYVRTPQISVNASITNTNGFIRAEGSSNAGLNVSVFNSGTITGGTLGDISNANNVSPAYRFDVNNGTLSGATYGNVAAYDTTSPQFVSNCSPIYYSSTSLPVTLLHFDATAAKGGALLTWQTTNEYNTDQYEVQVSAGTTGWQAIGSVKATGKNPASYTLTDGDYYMATHYYRLKIMDATGAFTFSKVQMIAANDDNGITLYPNPADRNATLRLPTPATEATAVYLVDMMGKVQQQYMLEAGARTLLIPLQQQQPGIYVLRSNIGGGIAIRLVKVAE